MIHDHRNGTSVYTLRAIDVLLTVLWDVTRMPATLSRNCYISMCLSFAIINGFAEFDDIEEGLDSGEPLFFREPRRRCSYLKCLQLRQDLQSDIIPMGQMSLALRTVVDHPLMQMSTYLLGYLYDAQLIALRSVRRLVTLLRDRAAHTCL